MRPRSFAKLCKKQLHYVYVIVYTQVVKYVCVCVCAHTDIAILYFN